MEELVQRNQNAAARHFVSAGGAADAFELFQVKLSLKVWLIKAHVFP